MHRIAGDEWHMRSLVLAEVGAVQSGGLEDDFIAFGGASDVDEAEPEQAAPPTAGSRHPEPLNCST